MKRIVLLLALICFTATSFGQKPDAFYKLGPDSTAQEGVPQGEIRGPFILPCKVFSGTQHDYWVYVPAQYDPGKATRLMIFQDGQAFKDEAGPIKAHHVMDNLIFRREIPVMIAVFINPGRRPDQPMATLSSWGDKTSNRPEEYNSLDDRYARVIVDELIPKLKEDYNLSDDPKDRGIGGSSSGAIAAFTVAWHRPDQFHKVLSFIGSYTNIRGGDRYPQIVAESEMKPIRVFFQDGRNDHRGDRGDSYNERWDWFKQNVRLAKAMEKKGYDVNYCWGIGRHSSKHGGAMMPEMMRWLWRDHGVSIDPDDDDERSYNAPKNND